MAFKFEIEERARELAGNAIREALAERQRTSDIVVDFVDDHWQLFMPMAAEEFRSRLDPTSSLSVCDVVDASIGIENAIRAAIARHQNKGGTPHRKVLGRGFLAWLQRRLAA